LFESDFVNLSKPDYSLFDTKLAEHIPDFVKNQIYPIIENNSDFNKIKIYYLQGPKASFTTSRALFIWLKTLAYFNPKIELKFSKISDFEFDFEKYIFNPETFEKNFNYNHLPRIHTKL